MTVPVTFEMSLSEAMGTFPQLRDVNEVWTGKTKDITEGAARLRGTEPFVSSSLVPPQDPPLLCETSLAKCTSCMSVCRKQKYTTLLSIYPQSEGLDIWTL